LIGALQENGQIPAPATQQGMGQFHGYQGA
jgi:hypothetical protein